MVDFPCYYTVDTDKVPDVLKPHLPSFSTGRCECAGLSFSPYMDIKTERRRRKKLSRKRFVKLMMGRGFTRNRANEIALLAKVSIYSYADLWSLAWLWG